MKLSWRDCMKVGVSIFVLYLCIHFWPGAVALVKTVIGAASPLLIGAAVAYVVNLLMNFYERHWFPGSKSAAIGRSRRVVCMLLAYLSLVAAVVIIVALIVPQLTSCVRILLAEVPYAMTRVVAFVQSLNIVLITSENVSDKHSCEINKLNPSDALITFDDKKSCQCTELD